MFKDSVDLVNARVQASVPTQSNMKVLWPQDATASEMKRFFALRLGPASGDVGTLTEHIRRKCHEHSKVMAPRRYEHILQCFDVIVGDLLDTLHPRFRAIWHESDQFAMYENCCDTEATYENGEKVYIFMTRSRTAAASSSSS